MTVNVQPGDFACVPVRGSVGLAIEVASWLDVKVARIKGQDFQPYEHAEVYAGDPSGRYPNGVTVSAYPDRHGVKPLDCAPAQVPGALWSSGLIPLTAAQRDGIVGWCYDHAAVKYSSADYLALVAHRLGLGTRRLQNFIGSDKSYICSQFVDAAYQSVGVQLFNDGRWNGFVTPLDLALLLESKKK